MDKKNFFTNLILITVFLAGVFLITNMQDKDLFSRKSIADKRQEFIEHKQAIISELIAKGDYTCCLKKPCIYCIEKTPGHGEGASCDCLKDVVEGRHPCGECMGEILEGKGNPYLAEYFPVALADEIGQAHLEELKKIINEKYNSDGQLDINLEDEAICDFDQFNKKPACGGEVSD